MLFFQLFTTLVDIVNSDSGVRNTNTSEAGASGQADTFDDDLQIDEEEVSLTLELKLMRDFSSIE